MLRDTPRHGGSRTLAALAIVGLIFYAQILVLVTVPVAAFRAGLSPTTVGLLLALPGASSLVADVPIASLSDAIGRRPFVVLGGLVLAAAGGVLSVASTRPVLWGTGMALTGLAMAMLVAPALAHLTESVAVEDHRRVQGMNGSVQAAMSIIAALVSGVLLNASLSTIALVSVVISGVLVSLLGIWVRGPVGKLHNSPVYIAARGFRTAARLVRSPLVALATALAVAYGLLFLVAGNGFLPTFAISLAVPPAIVGILLGLRTFVVMVVSPSFARIVDRFGLLRPVVGLTVLGAVGLVLVPVAQLSPLFLIPAVLLQGLGIAYSAAAANIWITEATPSSMRAVAIATSNLGSRIALLVASPLFGILAQRDASGPFLAAAAALAVLAFAMRRIQVKGPGLATSRPTP